MALSRIRSIALWLAICLSPIVLIEVGLRVFTGVNSQWNLRIGASKQFDPVTKFRNKPDYDFGNGIRTNESGYFAPRGIAHDKPDAGMRIIYLGDSVTFHPLDRNYPRQVEEMLERSRGEEVETLNAAVAGFDSDSVRAMLENEIGAFEADHLFVYVGWNDVGQYGPEGLPYKRRSAGYELSPLQNLLSQIYTVRLVYAVQRLQRQRLPAVSHALAPEDAARYASYMPSHYEENLRAIVRFAKERYPHVHLMNLATISSDDPTESELEKAHFPTGMDKNLRKLHQLVLRYNEVVERVAVEEGVDLVDLFSEFASPERRGELTDSCHVTAAGAEVIAEAVVRSIDRTDPAAAAGPS